MKDFAQIRADSNTASGLLAKSVPEAMTAFGALHKAAICDGAVSAKVKEFVALALGVAARCDPCIAHHAKALADMGATREEVADIMSVCMMMGGGPSVMYAGPALAAFDQFREQK